jgi:very-short-patch-repair endonuclease
MSGYPKYDDGLDEDGYPIKWEPRLRYVHGSEAEAGDWRLQSLSGASTTTLARLSLIVGLSADCDSPIESQIGAAVMMLFQGFRLPLKLCKMIDVRDTRDGLLFVPQFAWSYYWSDWAILNPTRHGALLIECDGRDFHSTKEQLAHDAKKDAEARIRGYRTIRFTGSQIHKDADGCARKIFDVVCGS